MFSFAPKHVTFSLRYDVAKLCNMDYKDAQQKKLVDAICAKLPSDEDWDTSNSFEQAFKSVGLKRYKLDKKLLGISAHKTIEGEELTSSSSKDTKAPPKAILDFQGASVPIKVQNPAYQELSLVAKVTKSASVALGSHPQALKKILPGIITCKAAEGFHFLLHSCFAIQLLTILILPFFWRQRQRATMSKCHQSAGECLRRGNACLCTVRPASIRCCRRCLQDNASFFESSEH